ncbi:MAG: hypothetical protein GY716_05380 [bacterium]|nr:hypothetical protein [bacterium]
MPAVNVDRAKAKEKTLADRRGALGEGADQAARRKANKALKRAQRKRRRLVAAMPPVPEAKSEPKAEDSPAAES